MPEDAAVEVRGLTRRFGDFVAVDDLQLSVARGEIFGFLGPNGAGKSTTIKMLCGLLRPSAGTGSVAGHDIMTESEAIKLRIGYMSQRFSLYEDLTAEENLSFFSGVYGVRGARKRERMERVLEMAGLSARRKELTRTLPGGFRQRLALGCAILHEPAILFLDEPTSGVDPLSRRNFWDLIYDMSQTGTTVFVTTHYMDEADYCDRLCLIFRGRIAAEGTPDELKRSGMKRDVLEIAVDNVVDAIEVLAREGIGAAIFGSSLHATVDSASAAAPRVTETLTKAGIAVREVRKIMPSLEDVFVSLIEEA